MEWGVQWGTFGADLCKLPAVSWEFAKSIQTNDPSLYIKLLGKRRVSRAWMLGTWLATRDLLTVRLHERLEGGLFVCVTIRKVIG